MSYFSFIDEKKTEEKNEGKFGRCEGLRVGLLEDLDWGETRFETVYFWQIDVKWDFWNVVGKKEARNQNFLGHRTRKVTKFWSLFIKNCGKIIKKVCLKSMTSEDLENLI